MTGHWVSPVEHDRTRLVVISRFWILSARSLRSSASSHHLTIGIGRSLFEERGHVACIARLDAVVQRPINLTGASSRPVFSAVRSPTALY